MSGFGNTPTGAAVPAGSTPISEGYVPNTSNSDLTAVESVGPINTDGNGQKSAPVAVGDIERAGYIALTSPPTQTNAGTETILTFSSQVNRVEIYNGSSANLNYDFDQTATAGSLVLPPSYQLDKAKKVTVVHILTATAINVNGTAAGNIIVRGSL